MRGIRLAVVVALMALAPVALAACGSSDSSTSSADESEISNAITQAATSGEASACTEFQTQKFTEQTSGGTGEAAVKSCEKDAADSASDSVEVTNTKVDGDTATVEAAFTGGFIDGQTLEISMVKDGDQWKVDQLTGFAEFNRDQFITSALGVITEQTSTDPSAPAGLTDCLQKQFDNATDQQLEDVVLSATGGETLFTPCFQGQ